MKKFVAIIIMALLYCCGVDNITLNETVKNGGNKMDIIKTASSEPKLFYEMNQYLQAYDRTLTLWPVPYKEMAIETSYGNAYVITSGPENAPPVVLLHGMNASSTMWYPNVEELSKDHKVYAIDNLTEPGKSEMNRKVKNMNDLINWYIQILDKLDIHDFILIGASKGGWLAVNLTLHIKDRVKKLILLSPLQTLSTIRPGIKVLSSVIYALHPNRKRLHNTLESMSANVSGMNKLYVEQFYLGTKMAYPARLISFKPFSHKQLEKLKMPVLVLIGDKDIINKASEMKKAHEFISQAETSVVPNAGHFLSMDQSEIVNQQIVNFMNTASANTAAK